MTGRIQSLKEPSCGSSRKTNFTIDKVLLFDYYRTMKNIDLVKIFKALSSEQRFNLFKMLYEWYECGGGTDGEYSFPFEGIEKCFTKACCSMSLSRSTISHHFKELQNAGLITYTRNGQCFVCKINLEAVQAIRNFLK